MKRAITIAGCGCSLADFLYTGVDFSGDAFQSFRSKETGDGGLKPGALVFMSELERFTGCAPDRIVQHLVGNRAPDATNVGGPAVVALVQAAQLLCSGLAGTLALPLPPSVPPYTGGRQRSRVMYCGAMGNDEAARQIRAILEQTPLDSSHYISVDAPTPSTVVLSDPAYDGGHGERCFINTIGASNTYGPGALPDEFYQADIALFGATALVPQLHDNLADLVEKAKAAGCVTVVTTVFDFRNEALHPGARWPLGDTARTLKATDLFIADKEEGLRISGCTTIGEAVRWFADAGAAAAVITDGPNPVVYCSDGKVFAPCTPSLLPVSDAVVKRRMIDTTLVGDTTGCGDNFAGGVLASLAVQLGEPVAKRSLPNAIAVGVCAGGGACFQVGGVYLEKECGEKRRQLESLYVDYVRQIAHQHRLPDRMLGDKIVGTDPMLG